MTGKIKDLKGKKFGRLIVLELSNFRTKSRGAFWKVKCECGTTKIVRAKNLLNGCTKSCGCFHKDLLKKRKLPEKEVCLNRFYDSYKRGAESRNLSFELTKEEVLFFCKQNCFYCGEEPSEVKYVKYKGFLANGLDRVDNKEGYTSANTVPCCAICNSMKSKMSKQDFLNQISKIHNNWMGLYKRYSQLFKEAA